MKLNKQNIKIENYDHAIMLIFHFQENFCFIKLFIRNKELLEIGPFSSLPCGLQNGSQYIFLHLNLAMIAV